MSIKTASILSALLILATVARAETPPADVAKENAELKAKVEQLKNQIHELELKLDRSEQLRQQLDVQRFNGLLQYTPATQPAVPVPAAPARPKMPRGAVEKKFDDITFYVIPIGEGTTLDSTTTKNSVHANK